tara:strand:- start:124 stop:723 length:600 start_codon:yes stop_codon:yes gene_type:complete
MTQAMLQTAQNACPNIAIKGWTSHQGPAAIQGPEDGEACLPHLLKLVKKASTEGASAIIIGCFDDTGLEAARNLATCPVIGIGQAAYHLASLVGDQFSVVTTLRVSLPILEANVHDYGLSQHLVKVRASGVQVLALETDADAAAKRVFQEILLAQKEDNVHSVVLGCAGMSHIPDIAGPEIKVRLIDGVKTAVQLGAMF